MNIPGAPRATKGW